MKDDEKGDPFIGKEALEILDLLTAEEHDMLVDSTKKIAGVVRDEMAKKGLELYDIKFEFGKSDGKIILIDEISGGCMRAYKDGEKVSPLEIEKILLG